MTDLEKQIGRLFSAELQFRLASAARLAVTMEKQPLDVPIEWSHGHTKVKYEDVALRQDQADFAAWNLHRSATFLMAVAMKDAIKFAQPDPKNSTDQNVKSAYQISRLIRNSFAHSPFDPIWSIDPNCRDTVFEVEGIISLDTHDLQGKPFDWKHYGGPLALYMLCLYVRFEILKDEKKPRKVVTLPEEIYYQQGDLILMKLREDHESL
jgi:hypothetical protein